MAARKFDPIFPGGGMGHKPPLKYDLTDLGNVCRFMELSAGKLCCSPNGKNWFFFHEGKNLWWPDDFGVTLRTAAQISDHILSEVDMCDDISIVVTETAKHWAYRSSNVSAMEDCLKLAGVLMTPEDFPAFIAGAT